MKRGGFRFIRLFALLAVLPAGQPSILQAQAIDAAPVYYAPDGRIYFRKAVPYSLMAVPAGTPVSASFPLGSGGTARSFDLEEGPASLSFRTADGKTQQVDIVIDGTAPVTTAQFTRAPHAEIQGTAWYGRGLQVVLTATDAASGVLQTMYRLNETPAAVYTGPVESFTKDGSFELTLYSADRVGNRETDRRHRFSIDVTGPVLTYAFQGPRYQNYLGPDAEIVLTAADQGAGVDRMLMRTGRRSFQVYRKPVAADSLSDGAYTLVAYGIDRVDNAGDSLKVPFFIDKTAPEILADVEGRQTIRDGVVFIRSASKVRITAKDPASGVGGVRFSIDEKQELEYRQPFIVSTETGGAVIEYSATDRIGNTSDRKSIRVFVDETPPVTSFDFPQGYFREGTELLVNRGGTMTLEAGDLESGVSLVEFRIGKEAAWQKYEKPVLWDKTGAFACEIRATDALGNVETPQKLAIRVQDRPAAASGPDASAKVDRLFREDQGQLTGAGELPFYLWISDKPDGTGQRFLLAGPDAGAKKGKGFTLPQEGTATLSVSMPGQRSDLPVVLDRAPARAVLKVNEAPKFTAPDGRIYFSNALEFQLSASDNITGVSSIMVSEDGGRFQNGKTVFRNYSSERPYQVRYFGVDMVGNAESIQEFAFIIDATPPKTQHKLVRNFAGNTLSPETVLELSASDNLSGVAAVRYRIDSQPERIYAGPIRMGDLKDLGDGPHILYYRAADQVQNREAERQFAFKYDSRRPDLEVALEGRTHTRDNRIYAATGARIMFRNPDPKKELRAVWFSRNDGEQQPFSGAVSLDAAGPYTLTFGAEDVLGNKMPPSRRSIIPDNRPPSVSHAIGGVQVAGAGGAVIIGPSSTLQFSASDDDAGVRSVSWRAGGQGWRTASGPARLDIAGPVEVSYQAVDHVGNAADPQKFQVINDLSAPELDITVTPPARTGPDGSPVILQTTVIVLAARDALTDVKSIVYRVNDGPEQPYVRPLTALPAGKVRLVIQATDLVGNVKTETRTFTVE